MHRTVGRTHPYTDIKSTSGACDREHEEQSSKQLEVGREDA